MRGKLKKERRGRDFMNGGTGSSKGKLSGAKGPIEHKVVVLTQRGSVRFIDVTENSVSLQPPKSAART